MPKMVCAKCEVELYPEKNGVYVKELFQHNSAVYCIWAADLWKCPICGLEVVAGFGEKPIVEHYEPHFQRVLDQIDFDPENKVYLDKEVPNAV